MNESWRVLPDLDAISREAARTLASSAERAIKQRARFTLVLAGGSTPGRLYTLLAHEYRDRIQWSAVEFFFGDERCVPPDHPDSNYGLARRTMLQSLAIPAAAVHRMEGERGPLDGADRYESMLRERFREDQDGGPLFDLVLLGMGSDGHTLSLFQGRDFEADRPRWAAAARAPAGAPSPDRITLTLGAVAGARQSLFMVAGRDKANALRQVRESRTAGNGPPAARITCKDDLLWLVDEAAAGSA